METMPYIQSEVPDNAATLSDKLQTKMNYLMTIQTALDAHDDRQVYELIDQQKYNKEIRQDQHAASNRALTQLVQDLQYDLSHALAQNVIKYLSTAFPFFYYEETRLGIFEIYFGNWWDRRRVGVLDPLSVRFIFDDAAYGMLTKSVELSKEGSRYHAALIDELTQENRTLQKIASQQAQRNQRRAQVEEELDLLDEQRGGFFGRGQQEEEREQLHDLLRQLDATDQKAMEAPELIVANNDQILKYSKLDTLLIYEQRAINETFGSFAAFEAAVDSLYVDYVSTLVDEKDRPKKVAPVKVEVLAPKNVKEAVR